MSMKITIAQWEDCKRQKAKQFFACDWESQDELTYEEVISYLIP